MSQMSEKQAVTNPPKHEISTAADAATHTPSALNLVDIAARGDKPATKSDTTSSASAGGGISSEINSALRSYASDPVRTAVDFLPSVALINGATGWDVGAVVSSQATGFANEVLHNPLGLLGDVATGAVVGAASVGLAAALGVGALGMMAVGAVALGAVELYKNSGNGISGEITGAINDAKSAYNAVAGVAHDMAVVGGAAPHTDAEKAASRQGLENLGAWEAHTAAFTVGTVAGTVATNAALSAWRGSDAVVKATASDAAAAQGGETVMVNGVPVTGAPGVDVNTAVHSQVFQDWINTLDPNIKVSGVNIQGVDMFGDKVGFVKFKVDATNLATGLKLPNIVFARGDSVGVLPVLETPDGKEWAVTVRQARLPIGKTDFSEIPAGMTMGEKTAETAVREMAEETGMLPGEKNLLPLGSFYPSSGANDEQLTIYAIRQKVTQAQLDQIAGRVAGLAAEHEQTKVAVVPLEELLKSEDAKTIAAYARYMALPSSVKSGATAAFDMGAPAAAAPK
jgi:ADP-sugar diphosphatase